MMRYLLGLAWRGWNWFWAGITGDIRSAIVGAFVAALIAPAVVKCTEAGPPKEIEIRTGSAGFAKPMVALLEVAVKDDQPTVFTFDPEAFKNVWVCEYSHLTGRSGRELMLAYLSKYSMCFSVVQTADRAYTVRPNPNASAEFRPSGNQWFCRCK
jgi:hypothetical protein